MRPSTLVNVIWQGNRNLGAHSPSKCFLYYEVRLLLQIF
jgi:hypothetical protein